MTPSYGCPAVAKLALWEMRKARYIFCGKLRNYQLRTEMSNDRPELRENQNGPNRIFSEKGSFVGHETGRSIE